jgi:hypothetical protein
MVRGGFLLTLFGIIMIWRPANSNGLDADISP